ncbi:BatD family protein [Pseudoalteromonas sp. T1lg10]|uniref:BatD family protein n=1 Tax=Pseudoalteromonas sp. T1lg10 TaxID=2077093 RepID=UPI000CF63C59|nr:BatD family protein [Pseudoalteromonas sp. T1lg10]
MVRSFLYICFICLSLPTLALSQLEASVDKNPVSAGEYFMLTLSADDTITDSQPDTQVLLQDFVVGPTYRSTNTQIINGVISRKTSWRVELMARNPGQYKIPAFEIKGISSTPFTLNVVEGNEAQGDSNNAFIKTELTPASLYVQQAAIYTVKLYVGVDLIDAAMSAPAMGDANVAQLGRDSESQEVIDGRRYRVIQREYLIQPQKSGTFELQAPVFEGKVRVNYRPVAISARGTDQLVDIKPTPAQYSGAWLPSELVDLSEQWQGLEQEVKVGTPITRTLTLTALNVTKEQLPDLTSTDIEAVRSYADQSERTHVVRNGRIIAQTKTSIAYVPQKPGTYTLPAISINWFNTVTGREQVASVPEQKITVVAADGTKVAANEPPQTEQTTTPDIDMSADENTSAAQEQRGSLPWWLALPGYLLWLVTLLLWWFSHKRSKAQTIAPSQETAPIAQASVQSIQNAAAKNDGKALYQAIDTYAKSHYGNIDVWLALWPQDAVQEFAKLRQSLYSPSTTEVDYSAIAKAAAYTPRPSHKPQAELDSLY